jgi:hypothetical protein
MRLLVAVVVVSCCCVFSAVAQNFVFAPHPDGKCYFNNRVFLPSRSSGFCYAADVLPPPDCENNMITTGPISGDILTFKYVAVMTPTGWVCAFIAVKLP